MKSGLNSRKKDVLLAKKLWAELNKIEIDRGSKVMKPAYHR
jgi:hypothetical protein